MVHIGRLRPISDLAGRNVVLLGGTRAPLKALADRLEIAGCPVDRAAIDNFDPNIFARLAAQTRRAKPVQPEAPLQLPMGRVLSTRPDNSPRLTVKLYDRGKEHLLEIVNRGPMELRDIEWHLPDTAPNWHILNQVLPEYPVKSLRPGQYIRVPVSVSMGGPVYVQISLRGVTDSGAAYETTEQLSVYG